MQTATWWLLLLPSALCAADIDSGEVIEVDEGLHALVTDLTRAFIPRDYEDNRKWGKTKEVVDGLHVRRDGWQIKTHRTKKAVNHGTWTRYEVRLLDPENRFKITLQNVRRLPDGRVAVDVHCDARLRTFGRLSEWQYGVQLFSLSAEAHADVRLTMACAFRVNVDLSRIPPDVIVDVHVDDAEILIRRFRMRRISQISGPLVKQLSHGVREVLEDAIDQRRDKMAEKINKQIEKNQDKLRLSLSTLLKTKIGDLQSLLPEPTADQ